MSVIVLFEGYSKIENGAYKANCSCVLIKSEQNIIIDTMTAWDEEKLLTALQQQLITPEEIDYVICTHGHSDHIGCNHLFKNAKHIVGFNVSHKDTYFDSGFHMGKSYVINDRIKVVPTPGHTMQDVSVIVNAEDGSTIVVSGDLFERFEDLEDESIWKSVGSDSVELQEINRKKMLKLADFIIPGHGKGFKVPDEFKK